VFDIAKEREKEVIKNKKREEQGTKVEEVQIDMEDYQVFKAELQERLKQTKQEDLE